MPKPNDFPQKIRKLVKPYRVTRGKGFRLRDVDPADTGGLGAKERDEAAELLALGTQWLASEQGRLYAQDRQSLLVVLQAMDAAGKDSTIAHVMSGVNPQGCDVASFKQPSADELDHDYLWRCVKRLPERGKIGIFNRSYYEEVLVVRVHPEILAGERLPEDCLHDDIFDDRLEDIASFERYLTRNGTRVLKIFLHVSRKEQKKRFLARLDDPKKNWKFSASDVKERDRWGDYLDAYEQAIRATATPACPWMVVPADNKWFTRLVVAGAIADALDRMDVSYPTLDKAHLAGLAAARRMLMAKK
jgi:PPK2 family polyphosphate:nucleotide phosphotransferase